MSQTMPWRRSLYLILLYILLFLNAVLGEDSSSSNGGGCDASLAVSSDVPLSSLTPNRFYQICAQQQQNTWLGRPQCGDGTSFGFFVARPPQSKANTRRLLMEFAGGGACWDATTCARQADYLTFPDSWSELVGQSCSEIEQGMASSGLSMLCAKSVGDVDLTSYTSIIVPYCTQDVHSGDNIVTYDDTTVRHAGAHNLMAVLRYIYANFQHPAHIVLTGCSAGGTALPLVYHLLHQHYNHFGWRSTQISVLADSSVYLTPSYFLENAMDNWNPWTLAQRIGFAYKNYRYSEAYPTQYLDYILRKGSNRDQWGYISHTDDPVSQTY